MNYLHDNVFLTTKTAQALYHETAKKLPIIDFHTHLPQGEILNDHRFENLWELWLKHDHYKWRLMRGCGIEEARITGDASPWEKFEAFASIMPLAPGNPVHHWAHLELKRVFGIDLILNADNAKAIWDNANAQLASNPKLSVQGLLEKFNVELVCTTDAPDSDLTTHAEIAQSDIKTKVLPTFRVDFIKDTDTHDLDLLKQQHDHFHENGCRLSDHGMPHMPEVGSPAFHTLSHIAKWNKDRGWTMQLHLGPQRRVNEAMTPITGPDSGFDTMGSWAQTAPLIAGLNALNNANTLARTIVYNLSSVESEPICCALQNFQSTLDKDGSVGVSPASPCQAKHQGGLIQYGPAWWHLDHVRGIREQMDILTSLGAIGTSLGMLTDSRSFTSYVRHEYYRRLLCQYIGNAAEAGEMPNEPKALHQLIADICYHNPKNYFQWA